MENYIAELRRANAQAPRQSLGLFEIKDALQQGLAKGAECCTWATGVVSDSCVPNYPVDEFRIWFETEVCARSDRDTQTIQLVELRTNERFRVATDGARAVERFKCLAPADVALEVRKTLRLY